MQSLTVLIGIALVIVGAAARCQAAGELPASCRIQCDPGEMRQTPQGLAKMMNMGSGTLVDVRGEAGLVLTCHHVIVGAKEILVEFPNGKRHGAVVVASDPDADLAVLEIVKPSVAPVKLAATFTPGDDLIVAGYGGEGIWRATRGRTRLEDLGSQVNLVVGTDVRGGDSGGPALNSKGELVGVVWGCDGRTYVTSGAPLQVMLTQYCQPCDPNAGGFCAPCQQQPSGGLFDGGLLNRGGNGRLIQGADPIAIAPPAGQQPAAATAACDCGPKLDALGKRIDSIDGQLDAFAKRDELSNYLRREDAAKHAPDVSDFVKRDELPKPPDLSNVVTRDEVAEIAKDGEARDKSLLERIQGVAGKVGDVTKAAAGAAADGTVTVAEGLSWGKIIAATLGIGGIPGLAISIFGGLALRRMKSRLASAGGRSSEQPFHG